MIPTIETIVEDLLAGTIDKQQALAWLHQHAEDAYRELRDDFAAAALSGLLGGGLRSGAADAATAYRYADAMLRQRGM